MSTYSTKETCKLVGIGRMTLLRWLKDGKIPEPRRVQQVGGVEARSWTERDVERVRKFKAAHFREGQGRRKRGER